MHACFRLFRMPPRYTLIIVSDIYPFYMSSGLDMSKYWRKLVMHCLAETTSRDNRLYMPRRVGPAFRPMGNSRSLAGASAETA